MSVSSRKDAINRKKHGISLQRAEDFDLVAALTFPNTSSRIMVSCAIRQSDFLDAKLYALIFTETEESIRAISLRKTKKSEKRIYADEY